jgi:DNA polymerase-3 subunit delta
MAQKTKENPEFEALKAAVETGGPESLDRLYFFYGEERYMLDFYLGKIREKLVDGDFLEFNYHKFIGSGNSLDDIAAACDALPVLSSRTLVEVHDFDILKANAELRERIAALAAELPPEVCLIFVSLAGDYEKDEMPKIKKALGKDAHIVAFDVQEASKLTKWIRRHFTAGGKTIDDATAEYLSFITGGRMTQLKAEMEKLTLYVRGNTVTRADIDKLVTPEVDAQYYTMTDHIVAGRFDSAAAVLGDLLSMQEPPHKLIAAISSKLRQLLLARLLTDARQDHKQLMKAADMRFEFQARNLMTAARNVSLERCRRYVLLAAEAAYRMNSGGDAELHLTELLIGLSAFSKPQDPGRRTYA